jgi:hypothetical protein
MLQTASLLGTFCYEFRMQIRRPVVWILIVSVGLLIGTWFTGIGKPTDTAADLVARRIYSFSLYLPLTLGILLADRLPRDRRLNVTELLNSMPASPAVRLWGKYLGTVAATAVPVFAVYLAEIIYLAVRRQDVTLVPFVLPSFALIALPGLLFVGAFSIACTHILPPVLYSILFIGYWFWGNLIPPERMPTLTCTLLSPSGEYAKAGILRATVSIGSCPFEAQITAAQGWASVALLLGLAVLIMTAAQVYMKWHTNRN